MQRLHCTMPSFGEVCVISIISVNYFYKYWVCVTHPHGMHSDRSSRRTEVTVRVGTGSVCCTSWFVTAVTKRYIKQLVPRGWWCMWLITPRYVHLVAQNIFTDTHHHCGLWSVPSLASTVDVESSGCGLWVSSLRPAGTYVNCMK
jgi:hypothetical protein